MWLTERLGIAGSAYRMPLPIHFEGPLDRAAMERACEAVVARHPVLASSFAEVDGSLYLQRSEERPHFRYTLTELGRDRHLLVFEAHHLVFDGGSKDILLRDLAAAYTGRPLEPLPLTQHETRDVLRAREYWAARWVEPEEPVLPGLSGYERTAQPGECFDFTLEGVDVAGFTRFEVLFAALQGLLLRYGNVNPTIAVDLGTRTHETQDAIGLYVNELPVRAEAARDLITHARQQLREMYEFRAVPLSQAVSISPRLAIAPVSISYRRRAADVKFASLRTKIEWMAFHGTARNALHVQMVDGGGAVQVRLHYSPRLLHRSYVERIAADYTSVVRALVQTPQADCRELPLTASASRLDGSKLAYPGSKKVHRLVAAQAAITPRAVAVVGADATLTYAELTARAGAVAERLWQLGVEPGDRVAVRMRRSPDLLASLLGVWLAGGVYVPIDPDYPATRQTLLLSDSAPAALITDDDMVRLSGAPSNSDGLAYIIYTSGSTGRPKGVEVEHRSVVNLLHTMRDHVGSGVWLATASYSFDMSVPELWLPLVSGGTVVIAAEDQMRDAERLLKLIRTAGVTHVHLTPSTWQRLLEAGFDEPGVIAIAGAEALPAPLAKQIRGRSAELWNIYGPTETTVWSTAARLADGSVTIGQPLANTQVHVLDADLNPVPSGIPGELCIGGAGVARGYLNRPELTNERFVHTRWGRLYRTGDRVRLLADGELEWIGRSDNQIKLRGYRIELGEIEEKLLEHPGVRAAAVAANPELVAYIVGSLEGLKDHLTQSLPAYMVPAAFVSLPSLPLTPNGKLDRAALPAYEPPVTSDAPEYEGVAKDVFEVWSEVLGRNDIAPDDSLFELGGHSLTVTKISSRLRKRGLNVPLHVFFDHPTISGIVAAIEQP
ncbi:MAG TPA: non-ribosomal peptide synthetase [Micromonosporaceae bacterium]|nr:non-ribosomal peptide synthetase [Micromonosporaceae bacterium]